MSVKRILVDFLWYELIMNKLSLFFILGFSLFWACSSIYESISTSDGSEIVYVARHSVKAGWGTAVSINLMDADGNNHRELISVSDGYVSDPEFTPDGNRILFILHSDTLGKGENLYFVDENSKNLTRITNDDTSLTYFFPQVIPNSDKILVVVRIRNREFQIRTVNVDDGSQTIIAVAGNPFEAPVVLNDGSYIFYIDNNRNIIRMNPDNENKKQLTFLNSAGELQLVKNKLYFGSGSRMTLFRIYSIDVNGDSLKLISNHLNFNHEYFNISLNEKRILYRDRIDDDYIGTFIVDFNGKNKKILTKYYTWEIDPKFYPDGKRIIFGRTGVFEHNQDNHLFRIDTNGDNLKILTLDKYDDNMSPSFRPN